DELVKRCADTLDNPPVLDRRRQELETPARQLLALIGLSRQPCWTVGNLVELALALGAEDGLKPVFELVDAGLLSPLLGPLPSRRPADPLPPPRSLRDFETWLATHGSAGASPTVFSPPQISARAVSEEVLLPDLLSEGEDSAPPGLLAQETDGL